MTAENKTIQCINVLQGQSVWLAKQDDNKTISVATCYRASLCDWLNKMQTRWVSVALCCGSCLIMWFAEQDENTHEKG